MVENIGLHDEQIGGGNFRGAQPQRHDASGALIVRVEQISNGQSKMARAERFLYRPVAIARHDRKPAHASPGQIVERILYKGPPPDLQKAFRLTLASRPQSLRPTCG